MLVETAGVMVALTVNNHLSDPLKYAGVYTVLRSGSYLVWYSLVIQLAIRL